MPSENIKGLVDAALGILVEARRRANEVETMPEANGLDAPALRRLNVAITAAHTVLEPPSMATYELRSMGLWWEQ